MTFREKPEHELAQTADEELIAYLVAARSAGRAECARTALGIFLFRRLDDWVYRAQAKVESRQDAEELAMQAISDALEAAFQGTSPGEVVNLIKVILARRIADFYDARERKPPPQALPEESGEEERWQPDAAITRDDKGQVVLRDAIDRVYADLSELHRRVVDLRVFEGHPSQDTADIVNAEHPDANPAMSATNVDQIASRFRSALRRELGEDD